MFNRLRHMELRFGLIGKVLLIFGAIALLTVVIATMAWLSFHEVVSSQKTIVNEAIPAMDAVQDMARSNTRIIALMQQLGLAASAQEAQRMQTALEGQLAHIHVQLGRLDQHKFSSALSTAAHATVTAIDDNLRQQSRKIIDRLTLEQRKNAKLILQRQAALSLITLSESLVANTSAATTTTIANIYPMIEDGRTRNQIFETLDRLVEVNVDLMERMSELQLTCFNLKTLLERLESAEDSSAIVVLQSSFSDNLATLKRRIQDIRDPDRKLSALHHYRILTAAMEAGGLFDVRHQELKLMASILLLRGQSGVLASHLNEQASLLVAAGGKAIDTAGTQSRRAVDRGLTGFLAVAVLLLIAFVATLWILFRYHVLGRLKGMETAVLALGSGNYDVHITTVGNDPLASLGRALAQFRENARERRRLEDALLLHQQVLEEQVAARTTELKQSNILLEHEVAEHAVARQQAEAANNAKNIFMATLSHELRTPLSGVSGTVQLLRNTGLDARQLEYAKMIAYANTTLLEILEDMLSFSRMEAGKLDFEHVPFDLLGTIDDMLLLQSVQAQDKGIVLIRDVEDTVPAIIVGDRRKLNQILLNIIGNAIKFTDEGSITVSVRGKANRPGPLTRLDFAVTDTGVGVPADKCEEVFMPFVQVEDASHRHHGGTGLGLAICRRLVEAMGGRIGMESRPNEGTCVSFELDFETAASLPALPLERCAKAISAPERPLTVLVVEDDAINRLVCTRYLESLGHHALAVGDGEQALLLLQRQTAAIDAILMDISLPGASGPEVVQQIRALDGARWKQVPVILMSAHVSDTTAELHPMAGMAAFLSKPFTLATLERTLNAAAAGNAEPESMDEKLEATGIMQVESLLDMHYLEVEIETLGSKVLFELLAMFHSELDYAFAELGKAARQGSWDAVRKHVHRLRGAAGNIGMAQVIKQARRLELCAVGVSVDPASVAALIENLEIICHSSCDALHAKLTADDSHPGA